MTKASLLPAFAFFVIAAALIAQRPDELPAKTATPPDSAIIEKYQEILQIQSQAIEAEWLEQQVGRRDEADISARLAHAKTRAQLARAQGDSAARLQALKDIVALWQRTSEILEIRIGDGRISPMDLKKAKVQLLRAEIRLLKAAP